MAERFDAVIIGAGIIGAAVALELARKGWRTLNVDALPAAGYGSTSASAAVIRVYYSTRSGTGLAYEGYHHWRHWAEHLGLPEGTELARFKETGSVVTKTEENQHLRPICALMAELGIPFEDWDAAELQRRLPFYDLGRYAPPRRPDDPDFGTSSGEIAGAVLFPTCGYVSDPQLAARNLQQAAESHGARFRFNRKVVKIRTGGGRAAGVALADGTVIDAPVVVNAAGPHSGVINRMAGVEGEMGVATRPLRQEVAYVPAPAGVDFSRQGLICADGDVGCYWRSDVGNKLLIGGLEPACDPLEWVDPDDWIPIYDRSSLGGYYMAVGTSGNQFKNAPLVGVLMAELISACEHGRDHDREPVRVKGRYTGFEIDMGFFSRLRSVNRESSFSVLG
jgi:sarcosine oxidase subunit beta